MRDLQAFFIYFSISVEQEIEVERARALGRNALPEAAEPALRLEQQVEQLAGREVGLQGRRAVQEPWLVEVADRLGLHQGRDRHHLDARRLPEGVQGGANRALAVAEVRAEGDVGAGHPSRVSPWGISLGYLPGADGYPQPDLRRLFVPVLLAALCASAPASAAMGRAAVEPLAGQEWWLSRIGADIVTPPGPGVPLTIVDSGVDASHPEFAGRPNTSFLNDQTVDGRDEYHGTAVASVAAAPANGVGIVGIYPEAVIQSWDASPAFTVLDFLAASGIQQAAQHCPGVINLSFGSTRKDAAIEQAILTAFHQGCLVVAASGNAGEQGSPPTYPAGYAHVLTVGSTDLNDHVASFSTTSPGLDLAAPGVNIVAAVPASRSTTGYVGGLAGTSFSAPMVSAAAAWVWTVRPTLDVTQIFDLMRLSARDIEPPGFDNGAGYGLLDIPAALSAPAPARDPYEPNDDVEQVAPGRLFELGDPALTSSAKASNRVAARLDVTEDPHDIYRIWVPANRVVRATVLSGSADATARIWGPRTNSIGEGLEQRRRDLKGQLIRGGKKGSTAYVEVLLTGRSRTASYVLGVTAARR
jgi:subtilisin family serine protease